MPTNIARLRTGRTLPHETIWKTKTAISLRHRHKKCLSDEEDYEVHGDDQGLNRNALPSASSSVRRGYRRWHTSDQRTHVMATKTSITNIDLNPIPGKRYMSFTRKWREEFIDFLLVDRFHDDRSRTPVKQAGHLGSESVWCRSRIWSDVMSRSAHQASQHSLVILNRRHRPFQSNLQW